MSEDEKFEEQYIIYRGTEKTPIYFNEELGWRDTANFKIINHFPTRYTEDMANEKIKTLPVRDAKIRPWSGGSWWKSRWD